MKYSGGKERERPQASRSLSCLVLPTVVVDTDANAHAGSMEADAGPRSIIIVAIVPALDVSLTRRIGV
jgi:hypothetical protein